MHSRVRGFGDTKGIRGGKRGEIIAQEEIQRVKIVKREASKEIHINEGGGRKGQGKKKEGI